MEKMTYTELQPETVVHSWAVAMFIELEAGRLTSGDVFRITKNAGIAARYMRKGVAPSQAWDKMRSGATAETSQQEATLDLDTTER